MLLKSQVQRLIVLKLWQARDTFVPEQLLNKIEQGRDFDWDDLRQLIRKSLAFDPQKISDDCLVGYRFLLDMTTEEKQLANDPYQREIELWKKLHPKASLKYKL